MEGNKTIFHLILLYGFGLLISLNSSMFLAERFNFDPPGKTMDRQNVANFGRILASLTLLE